MTKAREPWSVLCFGDDNTWGTSPSSRRRLAAAQRWTGILSARLGPSFQVVEDGLSGRTTLWEDPFVGFGCSADHLPVSLASHAPADQVTIDETSWDVHGMAGTGSYDIVVENVTVAPEWTFVRGGALTPDGPFFRYPTITIAAQVLAVTSLGIAREALNIVGKAARADRGSATGAPNIGDREYVQIEIAKAEARLRAARLFFYDSIDQAWELLVNGKELDVHTLNMLRLSCTHVTRECAATTESAYFVSGMSSAENANHLSRCWRDVHLPTQHAFMGEMTYRNAGAVLFGRDPMPGYL